MTNKEIMAKMKSDELTGFINANFPNPEEYGTTETILKFLNWQDEEYKELKKVRKLKKTWKPKLGEKYWWISADGHAFCGVWDDTLLEEEQYNQGNICQTEEECIRIANKRKIQAKLERFAEKHNEPIDWNDTTVEKWVLFYDHKIGEIDFVSLLVSQYNNVFFSSEEIARQAVEEIGEENIKFWLGVDE